MARRSDNRGFGSMDPERRRRIASEGGRSSRGGRNRDYEDEYDPEFYSRMGRRGGRARWEEDEDYDRDRGRGRRSSSGGTRRSAFDRGRESSSRSGSSSGGRRSTSSGRRGFGSMPREEVRRIARMGGRARWGEDYDNRGRGRGHRGR